MANETYGAIKLSDANAVGSMLVKKMGGVGYAPKDWADVINLMGKLPEKTVSGAIANFADGADDVPVKEAKFYFLPKQDSGTPTPSSPISIDGWTGLTAYRQKKNLFDKVNGNVVTGYIATSSFNDGNTRAKTIYIEIKGGMTYTVSKTAGQRFQIATSEFAPTNGATYTSRQTGNTSSSLTITASATDKYLWAWIYLAETDTGTLEDMLASVQIEVGSTSTTYEAYSTPTTYPVSWSEHGTIYGGYVDAVTGEGKETIGMIRLDTLPFIKNSTQNNPNGTYFSLDGVTVPFLGWGSGGRDSASCNELAKASAGAGGQTEPNNTFWWNNASTGWRVVWGLPSGGSSLDDFMRFLTNRNVIVVGQLTTANDFSVSPVSPVPSTYLGSNNFYSDANGDTEVTYRADINLALSASATRSAPVVQEESEER